MESRAKFRYTVWVLAGILTAGTFGYKLLEGWNLLDSLYMTVITLTTVGFSEVHYRIAASLGQGGSHA